MGELVEYSRPDGRACAAYEVLPAGRSATAGVVVLQEYWGLRSERSHLQHTADEVARLGYLAIAPDLYHGRFATRPEDAQALMAALDFGQAVSEDIRGAISYLRAAGASKVAVLGFCMGGSLAIKSAASGLGVDAVVCYYGMPPLSSFDASQITAPVLAHFARTDAWCNERAVDAFAAKLDAGGVRSTIHRYDGQHAFMNHLRPEVYDVAAATLSWHRTADFLAHAIGP